MFNFDKELIEKYPLGMKTIAGTDVPTCTCGVAYLRNVCEKLLKARQNNNEREYMEIRESLENGLAFSSFFDAFELSFNQRLKRVNFESGIYDDSVGVIVNDCRRNGVDEITMTCSIELRILKEFTDRGCEFAGMTTIKIHGIELPALIIKIN